MKIAALLTPLFLLASHPPAQKPAKPPSPFEAKAKGTPSKATPSKAAPTKATQLDDTEARKLAVAYLKALEGTGPEAARLELLGGLTLTAEEFTIPNWKIVKHEARVEDKELRGAVQTMKALDEAGHKALTKIMELAEGDDEVVEVSQEQAAKMMAPTREASKRFLEAYPVFAYVARAGKDVYWHPENPWRKILDRLGTDGPYHLELHLYSIEEKEPGRKPRVWPLRVLRVKTKAYDSGWKILPASDWDPDY